MNKDFYNRLPGMVCEDLDNIIEKYSKEEWFEKAWEEYRQHILNTNINNIMMPGYVFKKYIEGENKNDRKR